LSEEHIKNSTISSCITGDYYVTHVGDPLKINTYTLPNSQWNYHIPNATTTISDLFSDNDGSRRKMTRSEDCGIILAEMINNI